MSFRPRMSRVLAAARRHGISPRDVRPSRRRYKKLQVRDPRTGRWVHFGDTRYSDWTIHRNSRRRAAFHRRHSRRYRRHSPGDLAKKLLW